ncbi:MAG TPA: putative toxin-antitoxin system toxin component, PIN family [Sulfurospirillum arcachonense]|nr:putative toxin-antitoxin system toxin component, PIN family [Sulfurospirillum arcachonense]HIP44842.1 putative toxin-antitoxin system toxin component, PIN family [Sulfurospirillum arcachonense]
MKNIVIDTNVLLSAFYSNRGASYKLISLIDSAKFRVNISTTLIYEYEEILKSKSKLDEKHIDSILNYICRVGKKNRIFYLWRPKLKDTDDDFLLELAVKSNSIIVTLNGKDFKPACEFNIKVMTPKEFLQHIGEIQCKL